MRPIHIKSPVNVKYDSDALNELTKCNDGIYWNDRYGITEVDENRWKQAQEMEIEGWSRHWSDSTDDRPADHNELFNSYVDIKKNLGDVVELGCGPFTQIKYIINKKNTDVNRLTLVDPMIDRYLELRNCTYKNRKICDIDVELVCSKAEDFLSLSRIESYDTVICINVLEHVQNVGKIFTNIKKILVTGGMLVLGERTYNNLDINKLYDVMHPIRIKSEVIDNFVADFDVVFRSEVENHDGYLIAIKK